MELSRRTMLLLKIYDHDRFKKLLPEASADTTYSDSIRNTPNVSSLKPIEGKLKPNYPMKHIEAVLEDSHGHVAVVAPSSNILTDDLKNPFKERQSSRKQSARKTSTRKKRNNQSVILEKTDFEATPIKSSKHKKSLRSTFKEDDLRKSFRETVKHKKTEVECVKDKCIPVSDFLDISLNKGRVKTKSDFSTQQVKHYKSTFPDSITTSYFIKPGEPVGAKSKCLLLTKLTTTTTANHLWFRHSSRMRLQSQGTMSPSTINYPLNEEIPSSNLRKYSTELTQEDLSLLRSE